MKPILIITTIEVLNDYSEVPKKVEFSAQVDFTGSGDFSDYVDDNKINFSLMLSDLLNGKLKIKQP